MAMAVSPEVAKLFQVLTGEEWPDADEDQLRALAAEWAAAAQDLGQLAVGLRGAVAAIRANFAGEAERAFAERVAPFIEGDNLIDVAAQLFNDLAKTLLDLALDVEYMKLVIILSLIALIAEIAWAIAMSPFTGGATMAWLAARFAIVRFMIQNLLRRIILQVLQIAVFSIAFQLLIDAAAQTIQFVMGTRHEWNTKHTANAAGVGAMGAALALPIAGLGQVVRGGLGKIVANAFAKSTIKNITEISTEALHEMLTEALYKYATEGKFELNPYAATAGAASGGAEVAGSAIGDQLFNNDKGQGSGGGGNDRSGPPNNNPVDSTASGGSSGGSAGGSPGVPNAGPNGGPSGGPGNGAVGGPDGGAAGSGAAESGPNGVTIGPAGGNQPTDRTVTSPGGTEPGPSANNTTPNTVPPPVTSNAANGPNPQQPDPQSSETSLPVDGQAVPVSQGPGGGEVPPVAQEPTGQTSLPGDGQASQGPPQPVVPGSGLPDGGQVPPFAQDPAGVASSGDGQAVPVLQGPGGEVPPVAQESTGQTPLPGDGQVTQPPTVDGPGTSHSGNGQAPQQSGQVPPVAPDPNTGSTETPPSNSGQASPATQGPGMQGPGMQGPGMQGPGMQGPTMQQPTMQQPGTNTEPAPATQQTNPQGPGTAFAPPPPVVQQEPATTGTGQPQPVANQTVTHQPAAQHGTASTPPNTPPNTPTSSASPPSSATRLPAGTPTVPSAQPSQSTGTASTVPGTSSGSPRSALPATQPSQSAGTTSSPPAATSGPAKLPSGRGTGQPTGKQGPGSVLDQAPVSLAVGTPALGPVGESGSAAGGSGPRGSDRPAGPTGSPAGQKDRGDGRPVVDVPDPTAGLFGTNAPGSSSSDVQPGATAAGRTNEQSPSPGVVSADQSHGRPRKSVLDDERWRHFPGKTADWMAPADRPLHRDQWEHLRGTAPGTFTHVESELTAIFAQAPLVTDARGRRRLDLRSQIYPVRHDVRRIEVEPGRWVKEFTLKVHFDVQAGVDPARLPQLKRNTLRGVDRMYNQGYRMPDGDQFHVRVEFTDDPAEAYQHVRVWPDRERLTHNDWSIGGNPQDLAHELGHYGFALFDAYEHAQLSLQNKPAGAKHLGRGGKVVAEVSNRVVRDEDSGLMSLSYRPDTVLRPHELWQITRNLVGSSKIVAETPYVAPHGNGPAPEQSMFARAAAGDIVAISVLADQGHQGALVELTRLAAAGNAQARQSLVALAAGGELHALDGLARAGDNAGHAEFGGRTAVQVLAGLGNQPVPNKLAQALLTNLAVDGHFPSVAEMAKHGDVGAHGEIRRLAATGNLDALSTMVDQGDVPGLVDLAKAGNTDAYQGIKHLASQGNIDAVTALTHAGDVQGLVDAAVQNGPAYEAVKVLAAQGDATALGKVVAVGDVSTLTELTLANNEAAYRGLKSLAGLGDRDAVQVLYDHGDVAGLVEVAGTGGLAYEAAKALTTQGFSAPEMTSAPKDAEYPNPPAAPPRTSTSGDGGAALGGVAQDSSQPEGFEMSQYSEHTVAPPSIVPPTPSESTVTGQVDGPERSSGPEPEARFTFPPDSTRWGDEQRGALDALVDMLTNAAETRRQDGYLPPPVTVSGDGAQVIVDALADHGIDAKAEPGRADGADVHIDWSLKRANQDPAEQVLNDESWRHSTAETAPWFDPKADRVPPQVIENAARSQPVVGQVRGEQGGLRTDGSVWRGPIGYDIRRFDVEHVVPGPDGTPVRVTVPVEHHTTKLHLDPGDTGTDLDALRERVRSGVDEMYNRGYRTAGGRQFHVSVEFTDNPAEAHGVIKVGVPRSAMNQLNWSADATARELGHEIGHFQGMHDEYLAPGEPKPVFNHQDGKGHVMPDKGPMTAGLEDADATFKPRNMWLIENRMNALESTAGLPTPLGEFPEPPRSPAEEAARAAVDAARRRLDAAEDQLARTTGAPEPDPRAITAAENRVTAATSALNAANSRLSSLEYHNWLNEAFSDTESLHDTDDAASLAEQPSPPAPHRGLTDVLPRKDWYRLYLDPAHFDLAERLFPNDPGSFYDHDESPGFQASMEAAYERFLDPEKFDEQRLNADVYEQMHDVVNTSLKKKTHWTAQDYEATTFPLRAENPSPDVLTETLAGRPLLVEGGDYLVGGNAVAFIDRTGNRPYITTNYAYEDVKGLVDAVFDQFYADMANARTDADRLKAIGRAVRTVHIVHPFNDTNRRLNVHLLLPRLLLEAGFQPVAFKDMDQLFQGGRSLDQIADALARGQGMDLTGRIRDTDADSIASTDQTRPGAGRRELEFHPDTPPKKKKPVVAWAAAEVITGRHLPPPPVEDPGRVVFDDIVDAVALQYDSYGHFHADQLARELAARPETVADTEPGPWNYRVNRARAVVESLSDEGRAAYAAAEDEVADIVKRHHRLPEDRNPENSLFGEIMAVVGLRHLAGGHDSAAALSQRLAGELDTGHRPDETGGGQRPGAGSPSSAPSSAPSARAPEPRAGTPEPSPEFTTDVPVIEVTPAQDVPVIEVTPAQEAFPNSPAAPKRVEFAPPEAIEMGQLPTAGTEQPETGQENQQTGHVSHRHNPFADRITTATGAVDSAARARDAIASALGPIKVDNAKAQRHLAAIERSTRDTRGAVTATEHAFGPNPDRIGQARRNLTAAAGDLADARNAREEARTRHEEAADKLAQARENHSDDGIRRWARIERERARQLDIAEYTVTRAEIAHRQAVQDLDHARATETAMTAAREAHDKATAALGTAVDAVTTTTDAYTRTQAGLDAANTAAAHANTILTELQDAANRANAADEEFTDLTGRRDTVNDRIATLTGRRDALTGQLNAVDAQPVTQENRLDLAARRDDLSNRITELDNRITTLTDQADSLRTRAETARTRYDDAVRAVTTALERIDAHVRDARDAEAAANTSREDARNAVAAAEAAATDAEDAAKQGKVERGLTMLSFLPHNSELHIETLGDRDQLIDGLATASGLPHGDVADQVGAMSDEQVTNAINRGGITLTTPSGTVDVTVHVDLHRPADTPTASRHQQPAATKSESTTESSVQETEATSSTVPIRIPLLFVSPLDLAGAVMRPIAYVGVTGKRAQKFESSTTASGSTSSERTAHVPTTLSLTLSGPGNTDPVTSSIDAGLRLPEITRVDPVQAPLPDNDYAGVRTAPAVVPPAFRDLLGNSPDGATTLGELLLTQDTRPKTVPVDGEDVVVTPAGPARVTLAGTTSSDVSHGSTHGTSWQTTRGSDATFGFGLYGGPRSWYVGGFADFSTGLTGASAPGVEDSVTQSGTNTDLVYQVDRPMRVDQGGNTAQDTVSGMVTVPVSQARDLGLPLPPHLSGSTPGPAGQRYVFGRDDITSVDVDAVKDFVTGAFTDTPQGLSDKGRTAIAGLFSSQDTARDTVYDAMHGGAQAVWTKGGKTHILDIHAVPTAPDRTVPSGRTDISTEDKHTDKIGRVTSSVRTARAGVGGAYLPVGTDSPNPDAPKTTPEDGNPDPYQGGPTAATAAPRASLALNWEGGIANKSGYSGKDGRAAKYAGEMRDYDGSVYFVVVHRTTPAPNWAQRFFLGDRLLFGPSVHSRLSGPAKSDVEQALTGHPGHEDIRAGVVADAITVTTPADKLGWATKPWPGSTMTPGIYLGTPPPNPNPVIDPEWFGEYTNIEHVRISPNVTEGVEIALAKRIAPAEDAPQVAGHPAPVTRRPPKGSGNWSAWGQNDVTDTRNDPDGSRHVTDYTYKRSDLTRPGTTPGSAVRDFVGRVGSRGTAGQGFGGKPNSTGKMLREGRLSDFNGTLTGKAEYSAPRLVEVRPESTLKRNQAGDQVTGSTTSWGVSLDGEVSGGVIPRRDNGTGALVSGVVGGGGKYGRSHALELTSGGRQTFEYKGPTAFVAMDVRYRYSADMNLRTMFHRSDFAEVPVTVDEPDGLLVEMPVAHAVDMFARLGLPVPPELSALRPVAKTSVSDPAHTLLTGDEYASYSDTSVVAARLTDSLEDVGNRLTELGVTDREWRAEVVDQIDLLLNSPAGNVWLRDPLTGEQGHGGLISVPDPGLAFDDVVDIRVRTMPAADVRPRPAIEKLVPDKQSTADYVAVSRQDQAATTWSLSGAVNVGVRHAETAATPPGQPDANGVVQQAPPNAGASSGSFAPQVFGGARSWKTESVMDGSGSTKQTTQVDTDKVGRDTRQVVHTLEITRRRSPMPAVDTVGLGIPKHLNWDKLGPATPQATRRDGGNPEPRPRPVTLRGEVDLVSPSAQASPPLTRPARAPEFEVVTGPPSNNTPLFGAGDGWRVESIGTDTVNAIHDTAYAQLSADQPTRSHPSARDMADSASVRSEYTRPGSNSEYILHNAVKGTTLHNVSNFVFSGGNHSVGRILGSKHPFYDALFDYRLTGHFHGGLTFDKALPPDTTMNLSKDNESATPKGTTTTVSTSFGPAVTSSGANTHNAAGPAPTNVNFGPPASESIGNDKVTATSSKTGTTEGRKYEGRSYLFVVNRADFYSNVERHGSNWTHRPLTAIKDAFGGRPHRPDSTVKISSFADVKVRVWEDTALDKGLLTIGHVWEHAGKLPAGQPYTVTPGSHGATIHPSGEPAPGPGPAVTGPRGRTLHIAPGVSRSDVTAFIGSLPPDMRPVTYTVAPGNPFTATDLQDAVRDLPEPTAGTGPSSARQPGDEDTNPTRLPTDTIGTLPTEDAGAPVADPRGATGTQPGPGAEPPADRGPEPRPGKRSRDDFEADDGPVTTPQPPEVRPVPERLVAPSPEDTAALLDVVPPGRKFADPATFAGLINPSRSGAGRDVNRVDAALAFHATYHGAPRVAGSAPGGPRSGAATAAEEPGYAPELFSRGPAGLGEVITRVDRAGHGAAALVFGFPRGGAGHAWNVVNHNGSVSLVDAQDGTITPATPDALPGLDRVYAIPLDAEGNYLSEPGPEPTPPDGSDPYETAGYERAAREHGMRAAAAAGAEIPVPGTDGRLVPSLGGLRLVGAAVTASVAAELAAMSGRDVIALVIGPDAVDDEEDGEPVVVPEVLRFPPRGRPEPVGGQ